MGIRKTISQTSWCGSWLLASLLFLDQTYAGSLPPLTINGRLTASDGSPIFGPIEIEINFYHQERGGAAVLSAPLLFQQVSLTNGLFQLSVSLDPEDVNAIFPSAATEVWISIVDKTNAKQYQRQRFGLAAAALKVPVDNQTVRFNARGELEIVQKSADKLGSYPVEVATLPQNGQVLSFDGAKWVATTPAAGGGNASITATTPLSYSAGILALPKATAGQAGYLDSADFQAFAAKEPAIAAGTSAQYLRGDKQWVDFTTDARSAAVGDQISDGVTNKAPSQNIVFDALALKANSDSPGFIGPSTMQVATIPNPAAGNLNLLTLIPATGSTPNDNSVQPMLRFRDNDGGTPDYVSLRGPAVVGTGGVIFTLPSTDGAAGNVLKTDGAGNLGWTSVSSAGAGAIADTEKAAANGVASLNASSKVVQDPANATATATANKIPIADGSGKLDKDWLPAMVGDSGAGGSSGAVPAPATGDAAAGKFLSANGSWSVPVNATTGVAGYLSAADKTSLNSLVSSAVMDADFGSNGLMRRTGAGTYDTVTDSTSNWNTAYSERAQWDGGSTNLVAATGRTSLGLGTAATLNVGTGNNNIVQLDASGKLPAVDGSALTNMPSQVNSTTVDAAGAVMNADFSSNGIMSRTGAGTYSVVTDNSANWNTAYGWGNHASAGYLTSIPWATPGAIGGTTPAAGSFTTIAGTTITASTSAKLKENGGTHYVTLSAPSSMSADVAYIFPAAAQNGKYLTTDASGNLSWDTPVAGVGDMTKATYDSNNDGTVDNAIALNGHAETYFTNADNINDGIVNKPSRWNTAYSERAQWDGGSTNLVAATGRTSLGLGTAATLNVGTGNNNIVQLDGTSKLPAVDGSALTNLPNQVTNANVDAAGAVMDADFSSNGIMSRTGAGTYSVVTDNSSNWNTAYSERAQWDGGSTNLVAATARTSLGLGTAATLNVGTSNNNIVQLSASAKLPAVDGSAVTNLNAGNVSSGTLSLANGGTGATTASAALTALLPSQTGNSGKVLTTDGTNTSWGTSSSQWTTSSSDIYYNTGKVGIGTTAPAAELSVESTTTATPRGITATQTSDSVHGATITMIKKRATGTAALANDYSGSFDFSFYNSASALSKGAGIWSNIENATSTNESGNLMFMTANAGTFAERMRLTPSGKVGIGTTAPDSPLTVSAGSTVQPLGTSFSGALIHLSGSDSDRARILVDSFGSGNYPRINMRGARNTSASPSATQLNDIIGSIAGAGRGATDYGSSKVSINFMAAENFTDSAQGTSILFNTTPVGSVASQDRMIIDPSGNVGVGSTVPVERLEVTGGARIGSAPTTLTTVNGAHTAAVTTITVASTTGYPTAGTLLIGTEAITYTGTTSTTFTGCTRGALGTTAASISNGASVGNYLATFISSSSATPKAVITSAGRLGVGVAAPTQALEVAGIIKNQSSTTDCVGGWTCLGYFWDVSISGLYYSVLSQRSDRRLKKNIWSLDEDKMVERMQNLNPVTYEWRDRKVAPGTKFGFIAQEVEKVWPEIVGTADDAMKTKSVDYTQLISPLVKTTQVVLRERDQNNEQVKALAERYPDMVTQDEQSGRYSVNYEKIVSRLLGDIQELETKAQEHQSDSAAIREALCQLHAELDLCQTRKAH